MAQVQQALTYAHMYLLDAQEALSTQGKLTASMSEQFKQACEAVDKIDQEIQ